jgi:hypothetical protein
MAVEARVRGPQCRMPLDRSEGPELGEGEVVDKPAGARATVDLAGGVAVSKLRVRRDVGGRAQLGFVPGDQHAVRGC